MKRWPYAVLAALMVSGIANAATRHEPIIARPQRSAVAVTPTDGAPAIPAPPPATAPAAAGGTQPAAAPGGGAPIYIWKEKGVIHAVSNPGDVPPRYSRRAEGPNADPLIIRMLPEGPPPKATRPAKKTKRIKQRGAAKSAVTHKTASPAAVTQGK